MRTRHLITRLAGLLVGLSLTGCEITKTVYESPPDTTPPAVPRGVTSITGDREVTILWFESSEPDLAGYGVYRSNSADGAYTRIAEVTGGGSFVDRNVTNGVTYYYAVDAFDDAGNESDLSPEDVFDTPRPAGYDVLLYARASEPSLAGFDFSRGRRVAAGSADADIEISYDVSNGALFVDAANVDVDIQDFGYTKDLDDLDWAPDNGWSKVGWCELIVGHSYAVWTADDHYAKFRVTSKNGMSVLVDWAYQIAVANPELKPVVVRDSAGTYPAKH
jgi:hypothetical protein